MKSLKRNKNLKVFQLYKWIVIFQLKQLNLTDYQTLTNDDCKSEHLFFKIDDNEKNLLNIFETSSTCKQYIC
jgi:hypothetical protein